MNTQPHPVEEPAQITPAPAASVAPQEDTPRPDPSSQKSNTALVMLVAGTFFMQILDGSVITPAVPAMAHSFGVPAVDLNMGISAYMLTVGVFIPMSGWAAERFGSHVIFTFAIAFFTAASVLCGFSTSLPQFVGARILQGIGGAMMVPVGRLVVLGKTPKDQLVTAIAVLTWPALVAPVLGPPLGGFIADHAQWNWIFWLNLPLGVIAFITAWFLVPRTRAKEKEPFDWLGFLFTGGASFCLLLAADLVSRPDTNWFHEGLLAASGLALLAIAVHHLNHVAHPMFTLKSLKVRTFSVTIWGGTLFRLGVSGTPFLIPLMFQIGFGYDAFDAGLMLMAVFAGNLLVKPATTVVLRWYGFRRVLLVNGVINAAAVATCAVFTSSMPMWLIWGILFINGMTRSMHFTALNTLAFADIPQEDMTHANTLFSAAVQYGLGLGIAAAAIAWRIGEVVLPATSPATPFRFAFVAIAIVSLLALWDAAKLAPDAADAVARGKHRTRKGA